MGNCSYVNQKKSGPSKGWYCNKAGSYVDASYWRNYCSGSTSYRHCPYLGGDDRFRNPGVSGGSSANEQSKSEKEYSEDTYSSHPENRRFSEKNDYYSGSSGGYAGDGYSGGSSGGIGGFFGIFDVFQNLLDFLFKMLVGGGLIIIALTVVIFLLWNGIRLLGAQIGVVKSPFTINLSLPEESPIQAEDISFQLIGDSGTGKTIDAVLDEKGTCSINVRKDTYEVVQKYDGLSICLGAGTIDGTSEYNLAADINMMKNWIVRFSFFDEEGKEIFPEEVSVTDASDNRLDLVVLEKSSYVCPMVNLEGVGTLSVQAEGYEEVQVVPEIGNRIMNCKVVLRRER